MRLRQIALAASELAPCVSALTDVLGTEVGFNDPGVAGFGLENAVMPLGETFLDVVSPLRADAAAARWIKKRGGDAGYMVILQCDGYEALDAEIARAEGEGAQKVWEVSHEGARSVHFHPRALGAILSFDAMPRWEEWHWAGPRWRSAAAQAEAQAAAANARGGAAIAGAHLQSRAPEALAAHWAGIVGRPARADAAGHPVIDFARGGRLLFVPGAADQGVVAVEVRVRDRAAFAQRAEARGLLAADGTATIAGTRFIPVH